MIERNLLSNGRFLQDLSNWDAFNAVYSAGDGDDHYGVAVLSSGGGYIKQTFSVMHTRLHTLHVSVKPLTSALSAGGCTILITDGNGNTVYSGNLTGAVANTWEENNIEIGLATGTTYTLQITNVNHAYSMRIDDVWLWAIPMTRAAIASRMHAKLGRLATERSLSTTAAGELTEGSYTYAIDAGLRAVGAINPEIGLPDVRYLEPESLQTVLETVERQMIEQLQRDYAVETDIHVGQRSESRSQIAKVLGEMNSGSSGGGGGPVVVRKIKRSCD